MVRVIYVLFIFSGFIGLVYESIWARYLKMFLGHSSYGQILTLFIYMGGIGIGSFIGGKLSKRLKNPFYLYALVELLIGLGGFVYHPLYRWSTGLFFDFIQANSISTMVISSLKVCISIIITAPMAILLGITFPALTVGVMRLTRDGGKTSLSRLYFTNSLGAAIGIIVTSYLLIPKLGTFGALAFAATGNMLISFGFYLISRKAEPHLDKELSPVVREEKRDPIIPSGMPVNRQVIFWLAVGTFTGLSSFIYEIGWIRLLSMLLGSSTHSFDIMVSAFIWGLALGGFFAKRILHKSKNIAGTLAWVQILMGIFALFSIYLYKPFFLLMNNWHGLFPRTEISYYLFSLFKYLLCVLLMCPTSFFAGMTLPIVTYILITVTRDEKYTGYVYGWNTIGAIVGAVLGGLVLLPVIQLKSTIASGAIIDIGIGLIIVYMFVSSVRLRWILTVCSIIFMLPVFIMKFNPIIITAGAYRKAIDYAVESKKKIIVRDGITATISFHDGGLIRTIRTNGKPDASYTINRIYARRTDDYTQAALALFPMAILDYPYTAATIGMGSGLSAHYLLADPLLKKLDVVEIEKEVYNLARHFMPYNRRVYEDRRVSRIVNDAKTYFSMRNRRYDLIISEPSNPWVSGVASLFTEEFFQQISHYLSRKGLLIQWLNLYEFNSDLMLSIIKALDSVFPIVKIYHVPNSSDVVMIASRKDFYFTNYRRIAENPGITRTFPTMLDDPNLFSSRNYLISTRGLKPLLKNYRPNSDYFPIVDNGAEKAFFLKTRVNLFTPFKKTFCPYSEILEPEFFAKAQQYEEFNEWLHIIDTAKVDSLMGLLKNVHKNSDWPYIERRFIDAIPFTNKAEVWDSMPAVRRYKELVDSMIPPNKNRLYFTFIDNLIHQNQDALIGNIREIISIYKYNELIPFLIQSMLATCIKRDEKGLFRKVEEAFVKNNPRFNKYEKLLITEMGK